MTLTSDQRTHPAPAGVRALWWQRLEPLTVPAMAAVVALGVALRLWSHSVWWLDEAQTVAFARLPLSELHGALRTDGAPPLFYALLHGWLSLVGGLPFGDSVWIARVPSMLASIASLPLAYVLGTRLGGSRRHGYVTLLLFAANPWSVRYAGEARMYSLVVLLVLMGMLAGDWLRRRPGPLPVIAVGAVSALLLYTHYWAIFLLATVGVTVLVRAWRSPTERATSRRALVGMVGGGLLFLPWVPTMLYQSAHTGAPWAEPAHFGLLAPLPLEWSGGSGPAGGTLALVVVPLLLLAAFGQRLAGSDEVALVRPAGPTALLSAVVAGTLILGYGVAMATSGAVAGRYTAVVVPLVLMLLAFGVRTLPRVAGTAVLAVMVGLGLLASVTIVTTTHSQAGAVAAALNTRASAGDLIVYCPDQLAPAVEARLDVRGLYRLSLPRQVNAAVVDWTDYLQRLRSMRLRKVAERVEAVIKADPQASVWLVSGTGYRTHTESCLRLHTLLSAGLGDPEVVLTDKGRANEKARLERFTRAATS